MDHSKHATSSFDYTGAIWKIADNICQNVGDVSHIDMQYVGINYTRCKNNQQHGTLATLTPLRFEDGSRNGIVDGREMRIQSVVDHQGRELLYLLTLYLPRFSDLPLREKLTTLAHELWHISTRFDGELRRFPGKNYLHGNCEKEFDRQAEHVIQRWLQSNPPLELYEFLKYDLAQTVQKYGRIVGQKFSSPKIIPVVT